MRYLRSSILFLCAFALAPTVGFAKFTNDAIASWTSSGQDASQVFNIENAKYLDITVAVTGVTNTAVTFISGTAEVQTMTFQTKAGTTASDYLVFYDTTGAWAVALDKTGSDTDPTGTTWTSIAAARKVDCDISAASSAADVAAAVELCVDGMTGLTAVILTDDTAADGTMTFTQTVRAPATNAVGYRAAGTVGGITSVESTPAVQAKVDPATDIITVVNHSLLTGLKVQTSTSSALPTGLSTSTDYFVIKLSADTFSLASSLANALAGTAINITAYGTGTQTATQVAGVTGTLTLQKNNAAEGASAVWSTVATGTAYSSAGTVNFVVSTPLAARQLRILNDVTLGENSVVGYLSGKD